MCLCQAYGKSGVPNARGHCLVCGEPVWSTLTADQVTHGRLELSEALRQPLTEDRCLHCGALIGIGIAAFHLGICDECRQAQGDPEEPVQ
jgi:hypothetical protein